MGTSDDLVKGIYLTLFNRREQMSGDYFSLKICAVYNFQALRPCTIVFYCIDLREQNFDRLRPLHLLLGEAGFADDAVGVVNGLN